MKPGRQDGMSVGLVILRVAVGAKFVAAGLRSSLAGSVATDSSMPLFESTSRMGSGTRMVASSFRSSTRRRPSPWCLRNPVARSLHALFEWHLSGAAYRIGALRSVCSVGLSP
jgi:hypothetical protein